MKIQAAFFDELRKQGITGKKLSSMLCKELSISADSAYRRLRGETSLSFEEIQILSKLHNISLDALFEQETRHVPFKYNWIDIQAFNYSTYLQSLRKDAEKLSLFGDNEILFIAKDLPFFSNFIIPEIGEFKGFFWQKVALGLDSFKSVKFDVAQLNPENIRTGYEILKAYNIIPSRELWHPDVLNSMINQIIYCHDCGFFSGKESALTLFDKIEELLNHYQLQAETNRKFLYGKEVSGDSNFSLYYNDVLIGDNTTLLRVGDKKTVYFTHNIINNITTQDDRFAEQTWQIQERIINSSIDMSGEHQSDRLRLFENLHQKVQKAKKLLEKR